MSLVKHALIEKIFQTQNHPRSVTWAWREYITVCPFTNFNHLTAQALDALDLPQQQLVMLPRYGRRQHSAPRCRLRGRHRPGGCCGRRRRAPRADAEGGTADEGRDAFEQQKWWKRTAVPWVIWWFSLWYQCFTVRTLFWKKHRIIQGWFFCRESTWIYSFYVWDV